MSWKRDRPRVFEKVWLTHHDPYRRVQVAIYYQCAASHDTEHFYAELDGRRVRGSTPGEVRAKLPELIVQAYTYSGWAFFMRVSQGGNRGGEWGDKHQQYSSGQHLEMDYVLLLLGTRSDRKRVRSTCHFGPGFVPHVGPAIVHPKGDGPCCKKAITDPAMADTAKVDEFRVDDEEGGVVPFTAERLAWLRRLEEALKVLRGRLGEVMKGGGARLAKRLDKAVAAQMPLLLPPGPVVKGDDDADT